MNKIYVLKLFSRDSLNTMSKSKKKLYKLFLVALSTNLLTGNILNEDSAEIITELEKLLEDTYPAECYDMKYAKYREHLKKCLDNDEIFHLNEESKYDELISFTREILNDLIDKNVAVYNREKIESYIDVCRWIKNIDDCVSLIGVHFETGIYPFSPEKIVWFDFKVLWNMFAQYKREDLDDWIDSVDNNQKIKRIHDNKSIKIQLIAGAMERYVLVSCITYIECFLYNVRMVIKDNMIFQNRINEKKICNVLNNNKINDKQIIEDILYKIYPELVNYIDDNYQVYKDLLNLRDKYIHISVFEHVKGQPEMSEIVSSAGLNIQFKIKYAIDLVDKISSTILSNEGFNLLWWKKIEPCNFMDLESYSILDE